MDLVDHLEKYTCWYQEGHLSSNGTCFDIGMTCRQALNRFAKNKVANCGDPESKSSGNGSLMRLASVPMFYGVNKLEEGIEASGLSSSTSHASCIAIDACRFLWRFDTWRS